MSASQQSSILNESAVFSFLEFVDAQMRLKGTFEITLEELCTRLGILPVDAYRALYRDAGGLSGYVPDRFNLENMNVLAVFLSRFSTIDVEHAFHIAGACLSSDDLSELAALYYDTATGVIAGHTLQVDEYRRMTASFKNRRRAFEVYIDYFFDMDRVFENTVSDFESAKKYTFPVLGRSSVHRSLSLLIERHIVSVQALFEGLYERLTGTGKRSAGTTSGMPGAGSVQMRLTALRALGLSRPPADRRELKEHYKALMKTYHPDVNPGGLEMSKKINAAYAELLASWGPLQ